MSLLHTPDLLVSTPDLLVSSDWLIRIDQLCALHLLQSAEITSLHYMNWRPVHEYCGEAISSGHSRYCIQIPIQAKKQFSHRL